ncbi:MAG: hypothetical protein HY891_01325 [Deltaproteobacteria bacterium]|nr:hypothetical protein [Deltaproteobacteria bacterium]
MNRLKVLTVVSSLFVFAAVGAAQADMTKIYGPVYITKSKHEHHEHHGKKERDSKLKFTAPVPGNGVIMVKNGGDTGKNSRVSSAKIELNGVKIAKERDFSKKVATLQYNVVLQAENDLEVEVESCRTCELEITVLGEQPVVLPTRVLPTR